MLKNISQFNIVTGVTPGLVNDAKVLNKALTELGYKNTVQLKRPSSFNLKRRYPLVWHKIRKAIFGKSRINFHVEIMRNPWIEQADFNVWLPNPECVPEEVMRLGSSSDYIFCKTRNTENLLKDHFKNLVYIGFTSIDRYEPSYKKSYDKYLHVMGQSHFKGTRTLLRVWARHPEWPELIVVATETDWNNIDWMRKVSCKNVTLREGPLPEMEIIKLQNTCGIHLCPSEAEGFGHYIVEALSAKSIVLTTNAPPMNELVDKSHGFLVDYEDVEYKNMGALYKVTEQSLEESIQSIMSMSKNELLVMSESSREKYNKITGDFVNNLNNWLNYIL